MMNELTALCMGVCEYSFLYLCLFVDSNSRLPFQCLTGCMYSYTSIPQISEKFLF